MVRDGLITQRLAEDLLLQSASRCGLNGMEILRTARSASRRGQLMDRPAASIDDLIQATKKSTGPPSIVTRRASEIAPEPISWIWKYWVARGKPYHRRRSETGKTTIALSYAAIISSGGTWPDETRAAVGNVLIWTSEDDPKDTLIPRLIRMGADLDRIHFIEEAIPPGAKSRPFNPATDMPGLVERAKAIGDVALLILIPSSRPCR